MLSSTKARRTVTTAVVTAAVASIGATAAEAKVVTVSDDAAAEFAQGTLTDTVVRAPGSVELARTLEEQFDGTALPAGWAQTPWAAGGAATSGAGALTVDGARVMSTVLAGPGDSVQFTADLGDGGFRHVGFAASFEDQPWAIFSTGGGALATGLYARTFGPLAATNTPVTATPGPHLYRIDWTATDFVFFVDGVEVARHVIATHAATLPQMPVGASDFEIGGGGVSIDSIALNKHKTPGTYVSRKLDAGDARVTGLTVAATSDAPAGTTLGVEARTADTADGLDAAAWAPLGAGGAVANAKRFAQYRAQMSTTATAATPVVSKVDAAFTVDDQAPAVTIDGVTVNGTTAKVAFRQDDAAAKVECALDGGAFASCASPAELSGLAVGSHTIVVRATDVVGNVGSATRTFAVAAPNGGSGGSGGAPQPGGGGSASDATEPKVLVLGRSLSVSSRGVTKLKIRCPRAETTCAVTVKLKLAGKRIARKTLTMSGGSVKTFRLQLSQSARQKLATRSQIKVSAVVVAVDAAGNRYATTRRVTLAD